MGLLFHSLIAVGIFFIARDAYAGGRRGKNALHIGVFPFLCCEGAFSGVVGSMVQEHFSGASPQSPSLTWNSCETNMVNIVLLEERWKTKIYPCGETYMYIDVPLEKALPPLRLCLKYAQATLCISCYA